MELSSNLFELRSAAGMNRADVQRRTGIHLFSIGQLDTNRASRVPLLSIGRMCRAFGVGVAPVYPNPDSQDAAGEGEAEWLWEWRERPDGELSLSWALGPILERRGIAISQLYFMTHEAQSALRRMAAGNYLQVGLESIESLCRQLNIGVAPPPPGCDPESGWFFSWVDERTERIIQKAIKSDAPIPGRESKVCHCDLCLHINPDGVEKRIDAFPKSARYAGGRGTICNKGRSNEERIRRERKRADAAKGEKAKKAKKDSAPSAHESDIAGARSE
jgi:DNA-binding Xre family transcriptional regulator